MCVFSGDLLNHWPKHVTCPAYDLYCLIDAWTACCCMSPHLHAFRTSDIRPSSDRSWKCIYICVYVTAQIVRRIWNIFGYYSLWLVVNKARMDIVLPACYTFQYITVPNNTADIIKRERHQHGSLVRWTTITTANNVAMHTYIWWLFASESPSICQNVLMTCTCACVRECTLQRGGAIKFREILNCIFACNMYM